MNLSVSVSVCIYSKPRVEIVGGIVSAALCVGVGGCEGERERVLENTPRDC
jgi:hypothetical protein